MHNPLSDHPISHAITMAEITLRCLEQCAQTVSLILAKAPSRLARTYAILAACAVFFMMTDDVIPALEITVIGEVRVEAGPWHLRTVLNSAVGEDCWLSVTGRVST